MKEAIKIKSVQSDNPFKSLPRRQAGVILTSYVIVKEHGGSPTFESIEGIGTECLIHIPTYL